MEGTSGSQHAHECRQCCAFCDRVVLPSGCVEADCPYLYLYDDELTGRRYMGCLHKVFKSEIDVELFEQAQRTRRGFGGVKMTGTARPQCRVAVEQAYFGSGAAFECVNPGFFEVLQPHQRAEEPWFDLRDRL